jgi:hypothetical protein
MNYKKPRCRWIQSLASLSPELNPEARRILEKLLADETIPERQDLEGLKLPISKLVKVHRWTELFGQKIKIYRVGFCNWRYSVGDAAGAYYAGKRFGACPHQLKRLVVPPFPKRCGKVKISGLVINPVPISENLMSGLATNNRPLRKR